jgi:hypothetical protein
MDVGKSVVSADTLSISQYSSRVQLYNYFDAQSDDTINEPESELSMDRAKYRNIDRRFYPRAMIML